MTRTPLNVMLAGWVVIALVTASATQAELPPGTWPGKLTFADDGERDDLELVVSRDGESDVAKLKQGHHEHALSEVENSAAGLSFWWGQDHCELDAMDDGSFTGPCESDGKVTVVIDIFPPPEDSDDGGEIPAAGETPADPAEIADELVTPDDDEPAMQDAAAADSIAGGGAPEKDQEAGGGQD